MGNLKYKIEFNVGDFTDLQKTQHENITDILLLANVSFNVGPYGNDIKTSIDSIDGRNDGKPLSTEELLRTWMMLGVVISKKNDLSEPLKDLAKLPYDTFLKMIEISKKKQGKMISG